MRILALAGLVAVLSCAQGISDRDLRAAGQLSVLVSNRKGPEAGLTIG